MALFDAESARLMAVKAVEARRKKAAEREAMRLNPPPVQPIASVSNPSADYEKKRLARVRKQLDKLDRMIEEEMDPQKLDRLASAQSRLAKQEQELSGRPLPGSLRPSKAKSSPKQITTEPLE